MRKINRIVNVTAIFILMSVFLCSGSAYSLPEYLLGKLRIPLMDSHRFREYLENILLEKVIKYSPVKASAVNNQLSFNVTGRNVNIPEVTHDKDLINMQVVAVKSILDEKLSIGRESVDCLLYTSPSPRDRTRSRMPSSA